jgi:hypothetical protein
MGFFKLEILATGGHGQDRSKENGELVDFSAGGENTPEKVALNMIADFNTKFPVHTAKIIHWPGESCEVTDDLITGIRTGSFNKTPEPKPLNEVVENKTLRKAIDELIQKIKSLPESKERNIATYKLQEGVMWLGMDLKRLGEANPYPSSKDPSTGNVIEPTADNLKL